MSGGEGSSPSRMKMRARPLVPLQPVFQFPVLPHILKNPHLMSPRPLPHTGMALIFQYLFTSVVLLARKGRYTAQT